MSRLGRHFSALAVILLLAAPGCGQSDDGGKSDGQQGQVTLEVLTQKPAAAVVAEPLRVTLAGEEIRWENTEQLAVLFGAAKDTAGGPGGPRAILESAGEGRFKGTADLESWYLKDYSLDDIKAIATHVVDARGRRHDLYGKWRCLAARLWWQLRPIRKYLLAIYRRL